MEGFNELLLANFKEITRRIKPKSYPEIKQYKIPIALTGGIGDVILGANFLNRLSLAGIPVEAYTKHKEAFEIFSFLTCYTPDKLNDDAHIQLNSIVDFKFKPSFKGFKSPYFEFLYSNFLKHSEDWAPQISYHPFFDHSLGVKAVSLGLTRETLPYSLLGLESHLKIKIPKTQISSPIPLPGKFITIHNGFETSQPINGRSTKNWSIDNWVEFYALFAKKFPDIMVILLGHSTGETPIADLSFRNQLTLQGSLGILSQSLCHIDGDSGLVHAANALGVRSVVMFGPTPSNFFGYKENINLESGGCPSGGSCWWTKASWLKKCPLDFNTPKCMDEIKPEDVLDSVSKIIEPSAERSNALG